MMRVLLAAINAKYIHSNLAVYDLKAFTKDLPVEVVLGEYTINQQMEIILQKIYETKAEVVAFSCYIWNIDMVLWIAEELHKIAPETRIWLGGPEASYDAATLLARLPFVELIMVGEGEETFYELLDRHLLKNDSLEGIRGITYRFQDKILSNPLRSYMNMDKIPFVYDDLALFEHKIIYYETSRGCPFSCSYCLSSIDKRVRFRSLDLVMKELAYFLDHKVPQVKFVDRTFNCVHDHAYAIWKFLLEHDNGVTNFHFEVSSDLLKEEDFLLFEQMRPGLIQLEIGVQSTYMPTIEAIHRTMDLSKVKENVARVKKMHNIHQHLDLIAGLPYETIELFEQSFIDVFDMQPDQLQLGFLKSLKGSFMEEHKEEYELVHTTRPPYEVLKTKWLSYEDVLLLKGIEEMVEVYYNSGQFRAALSYVVPFFSSSFGFFRELAKYYKNQGLNEMKHTRLARYEIVRRFLCEYNVGLESSEQMDVGMLDEYLMFDLYHTEHSKKRPAFAADEQFVKECMNTLRSRAFRESHLHGAMKEQIDQVMEHRNDIYLEWFPKTREQSFLLFDYAHRDPLTNGAAYVAIPKEMLITTKEES